MPGIGIDTRFACLTRRKRKKTARPFHIEHRATEQALIDECKEWGEWGRLGSYTTEAERDRSLAEILAGASGRWEYRTAKDPATKT